MNKESIKWIYHLNVTPPNLPQNWTPEFARWRLQNKKKQKKNRNGRFTVVSEHLHSSSPHALVQTTRSTRRSIPRSLINFASPWRGLNEATKQETRRVARKGIESGGWLSRGTPESHAAPRPRSSRCASFDRGDHVGSIKFIRNWRE